MGGLYIRRPPSTDITAMIRPLFLVAVSWALASAAPMVEEVHQKKTVQRKCSSSSNRGVSSSDGGGLRRLRWTAQHVQGDAPQGSHADIELTERDREESDRLVHHRVVPG